MFLPLIGEILIKYNFYANGEKLCIQPNPGKHLPAL